MDHLRVSFLLRSRLLPSLNGMDITDRLLSTSSKRSLRFYFLRIRSRNLAFLRSRLQIRETRMDIRTRTRSRDDVQGRSWQRVVDRQSDQGKTVQSCRLRATLNRSPTLATHGIHRQDWIEGHKRT